MYSLGVTKVCSMAHPDTHHRWEQSAQMSLRCAKTACYGAAAAARCQREQKTRALQKTTMLGIGSPGKEPGLFLAGEVVLAGWWDCAVCFLPGISRWQSSAAPETEYSHFLTIPEAPVCLWSSVSGSTSVTKADRYMELLWQLQTELEVTRVLNFDTLLCDCGWQQRLAFWYRTSQIYE